MPSQKPTSRKDDDVNLVVVSGEIASPPRLGRSHAGEDVQSFDVASVCDGRRWSVPVVVAGTSDLPPTGTKVVVYGRVRRRFFRSSGAVNSRTEVVAEKIVRASRRAEVRRLLTSVDSEVSVLDAP